MADTERPPRRRAPSQWLEKLAADLVARLESRGLKLPAAAAEEIVADKVGAIAAALHISERAARAYLDQDSIDRMAERIVESIADEAPGADLLAQPFDAALKISGLGRLIAALARCADFYASDAAVDQALSRNRREAITDLITMLGLSQASHQTGDVICAPQALLPRISRILESTAELTPKPKLRDALRSDALIAKAEFRENRVSSPSPFLNC